jgi:hypothetical protein
MMPGAPVATEVSVAEMRCTPFCSSEIVEPVACTCSVVPAESGPLL